MTLCEVSEAMQTEAAQIEKSMKRIAKLQRVAMKEVKHEVGGQFTVSHPERASVAFRCGNRRVLVRELFTEGMLGVTRQRVRESGQRWRSWHDCEREMHVPAADVPDRVRFWMTATPDEIEADWRKRHKHERRTVLDVVIEQGLTSFGGGW